MADHLTRLLLSMYRLLKAVTLLIKAPQSRLMSSATQEHLLQLIKMQSIENTEHYRDTLCKTKQDTSSKLRYVWMLALNSLGSKKDNGAI